MFRIAPDPKAKLPVPPPKEAPPPPDEPEVVDNPEEEAAEPQEDDSYTPSRKASQPIVVYMDSSAGPFRCDHCANWAGNGECHLVEGQIDPAGMCHLFEPPGGEPEAEPDQGDQAESDEPLEEAPQLNA